MYNEHVQYEMSVCLCISSLDMSTCVRLPDFGSEAREGKGAGAQRLEGEALPTRETASASHKQRQLATQSMGELSLDHSRDQRHA